MDVIREGHIEVLRPAQEIYRVGGLPNLRGKLSEEKLWKFRNFEPKALVSEIRLALALSEFTLTLDMTLSSKTEEPSVKLTLEGCRVAGKLISASYYAASIAEHAETSLATGTALFERFVQRMADGTLQLPGHAKVASVRQTETGPELTLSYRSMHEMAKA